MATPIKKADHQKVVRLHTVGCRLNQYETERMAARIYPFGFRRAEADEPADLTIINTCTVTHKADSDCRQMIRKAVRQSPGGRVVVVGCYVDHEPDLVAAIDGVDLVVCNREKDIIDTLLAARLPDLFPFGLNKSCSGRIADFHEHNRAWVKISDGCNQRCSFCIVTIVRGPLVNRPAADIIAEIGALVAQGYHEVVLTGVNMGYYHDRLREPKLRTLADLCRLIMEETDLPRMRLSSIEPQAVKDDLIELYAQSGGRICRHFHLPLQSAADELLRLMRRPYSQASYVKRVSDLKAALPGTTVGADVIVGFPGETDEHFEQTRRLVDSGLLDYLHVFSYSDRPGTDASKMPDKIPPYEARRRSRILTEIDLRIQQANLSRRLGRVLDVIAERKAERDTHYSAISDNYLKVRLPAQTYRGREILKAKITAVRDGFLEGEPV